MAVPFFRLEVTDAEVAAVERVLRSGWLTTGKEALAFEKEFAEVIGLGLDAISVNSNTSGMHLVLEALGIKPDDEVIVPDLTFTATAEVVRYLGAEPVLVDVEPGTLCIDPAQVAAAITPRTKAVMVVHFGGMAADMVALQAVVKPHGIPIVEDAAHSFPASHSGRNIGAHGTAAAVFSFYANKTITTGEGGMIVTADAALAKRCRVMRLHGIDRDAFQRFTGKSSLWKYDVVAPGFKYNMTDVAAALGREQLKNAEPMRLRREAIAALYDQQLADLEIGVPSRRVGDVHSWHLYPITVSPAGKPDRQAVEDAFNASGIGYSMHYTPLHRMTYWRSRGELSDNLFPVSSQHGDSSLSLPIFSCMRDEEVMEVCRVLHALFR